MASVNKVILIGNLGRDPETRYTTGGDAVTNLRIATTDTWKDKAGEKQEKTEWHTVVLFGRQAEIAGEYLKKGRPVYIEGRLQTRKYTDKEGVEKYSTEIVGDRMQLLGGREGGGGGGGAATSNSIPVRARVRVGGRAQQRQREWREGGRRAEEGQSRRPRRRHSVLGGGSLRQRRPLQESRARRALPRQSRRLPDRRRRDTARDTGRAWVPIAGRRRSRGSDRPPGVPDGRMHRASGSASWRRRPTVPIRPAARRRSSAAPAHPPFAGTAADDRGPARRRARCARDPSPRRTTAGPIRSSRLRRPAPAADRACSTRGRGGGRRRVHRAFRSDPGSSAGTSRGNREMAVRR